MAKFSVLRNNQTFMGWIGIYSNRLRESTNEFHRSKIAYLILSITMYTIISCLVTVCKGSSELMEKLNKITLIVSMSQAASVYCSIGLKMKNCSALHLQVQGIVNEGLL